MAIKDYIQERIPFLKKMLFVGVLTIGLPSLFFSYYHIGYFHGDAQKACLPWNWYLVSENKPKPEDMKDVTYIAFKTDLRVLSYYPLDTVFAKKVAARAGDKVDVKEGYLWVNGKKVKPLSKKVMAFIGVEPKELEVSITLNDGEFWGIGTNPDSYDSTYWGRIKKEQVVGKVIPII